MTTAGGIICVASSPRMANVAIRDNLAEGNGSGICCAVNSNLSLENVTINNNTAGQNGGGIYCDESSMNLKNVTIRENTANEDGGGMACEGKCNISLMNGQVNSNSALNGGGIYSTESDLSLLNVTINSNLASAEGAGIQAHYSDINVDSCIFTNNESFGDFGGAFSYMNDGDTGSNNITFYINIINSQFTDNKASGPGAGIFIGKAANDISSINIIVDKCEISNNSAFRNCGMKMVRVANFEISNSVFSGNEAVQYAAGAEFSSSSIGRISNCLFANNKAAIDGGDYNSGGVSVWSGSNVDFINCTFADNSAAYGAGLTVGGGGIATTTNCIFWGNSADQIALDSWSNMGGTLTVNYCDVQDGIDSVNVTDALSTLHWGSGNIDSNPLFVDIGNNDYHLSDASPCISAAVDSIQINGEWYYAPSTDLEGNPRPNPAGTIPDIGAYESDKGTEGMHIHAGEVYGIWLLSRSPYFIYGEITIPDGKTLTIEPGVDVIFAGHYKLNVQGRLLAVGTKQDTITFTAQNPETGWHGIRFFNTPVTNDSSKIIYCKLQWGKAVGDNGGAIRVESFNKLIISHSLITNNSSGDSGEFATGGGINLSGSSAIVIGNIILANSAPNGGGIACCNSTALLMNNTIINNHASDVGGGIAIYGSSSPTIMANTLSDNTALFGGGINCYEASPLLMNNVIANNHADDGGGGGIVCNGHSDPTLINNTITKNSADGGGGMVCGDNSAPILINTILYRNIANFDEEVQLWDSSCHPSFYYCDVEGGIGSFTGEHNIDSDPLFKATADSVYHLSNDSPCIGTGVDSIQINGTWYCAPSTDIDGISRPNPAGSNPDIGAYESEQGPTKITDTNVTQLPKYFALNGNYPNPFNPVTTISYQLPKSSFVNISIYDITGRLVETLVNENAQPGYYSFEWDASKFSSGVYFYRIKAGEFSATGKCLLLK